MIYLDNAATTFPKPECVYDQVNNVQRTIAVNVGRGSYSAANEAMKIVDDARYLMAKLLNAKGPESVVLTPSATIAANEIILGLEWDEFKNVYVTPFEHNAIARPLNTICNRNGIKLSFIPFHQGSQTLDEEELDRLFSINPPDYVFLNHISNVTGNIIPVNKIADMAKKYDAKIIVDGSQSIGLIDYDLSRIDIDYLIFAGHKNIYGSWGIGGFINNSKHKLNPVLAGGTGSDSLNLNMDKSIPTGFEFASPNIIAIASLQASLNWLNEVGLNNIKNKKDALMTRLIEGLKKCGAKLYLPQEHTSVLSFNIPGYEADEVGMILNQDFDIAVRTGYHCAPFVHEFLGSTDYRGTVRASLGYFNTETDIESLIKAVSEIMED